MHGSSSAFVILVNAEVDSMGGVGIGCKNSPLRAEIEKVHSELRQEYNVRDEKRRELEYLEKGGNPLDFMLGNFASVSVQSTSLRNQHPDQFVTSEAKGSFAYLASPHGDSVESSGRPGAPPPEANSADNIMLFDGKNDFSEGDQNSSNPSRSNIAPLEKSSHMRGAENVKEFGDSDAFVLPRKSYKRRDRSRPKNDRIKSSTTDVVLTRGGHVSSLPPLQGPRDVKELVSDAENYNDQNASSNYNSKPTSPMDNTLHMTVPSVSERDMELDCVRVVKSMKDSNKDGSPNAVSEANTSENPLDNQHNQHNQQSVSEVEKSPIEIASDGPEPFQSREEVISAVIECQPSAIPTKVDNQSSYCHMNGLGSGKGDQIKNYAQNSSTERGTKGLDSESSWTQANLGIDGNNESRMYTNMRNVDSNGRISNQFSVLDGIPVAETDELVREKKETKANDNSASVDVLKNLAHQSHQENGIVLNVQKELNGSGPALQNELKAQVIVEGMEAGGPTASESERKSVVPSLDNPDTASITHQDSIDSSISKSAKASMARVSINVASEAQIPSVPNLQFASKVDEDSILEEARIMEAKQKRLMELSTATSPVEIRRKSHWDYVLEEMAWLANDFIQERLWKITAAAQICRRASFTSQLTKHEKASQMKVKKVAYTLAKAVMEFWHSVEEKSKELELQSPKEGALAVQAYAVNFLKYNYSDVLPCQAEAPLTPDRISDLGILDMSWEDHLTEENLFYTVQPEAMESYRKSIESHVVQYEKTGSNVQDEVDTSACDDVADNAYEEDEGETSTYDMSVAFDDSKSSRFAKRDLKHLTNAYGARSYKTGSHLLPVQCIESKVAAQQSALLAKRPGSTLSVSIPTKRMRTASRRVISAYGAGTSGGVQISNKTDASSGDTDSYQDDQSTLRGGSVVPNSLEVESVGEFEKQLPFESIQILTKPKKKKKEKHLDATYEQRWQVDYNFQSEQFQCDHLKKRSESHQLESNGSSSLFGQHTMKKPKIMRQSQDNSFDTIAPIGGSVPSPAASQISNMPHPNKFVRMLGGRDRGRKPKALKMSTGQLGSGSLWSLFEDQALVVLVHDLGPNWELVSDAINSTLQFKCIFRKPKECKERHDILMDRTSGDGEDSVESGSSEPYPSTLPGIPKGSARQLFQRLQGPMEEDTIKSHFEKIIMISVKQHCSKTQDQKRKPTHDSHAIAVSQVCPTNLSGGPILTPLDLCDATTSSPDIHSLGYQVPHSSGLVIANQATMAPMLSASGSGSAVQGFSNMMPGNYISMPPGSLNSSVRDGRYGAPRSTSLSIDEQQRMQQYNNQIISGRNIQQPTMSAPGAFPGTDRGVRMLSGSMGMVSGVNRSMPIVRPGFQGLASSSMVNSGSMVSPGAVSVNMQSGLGSGQNSVFRPRDTLHMMRPGMSQDSQRQMIVSDLQMQASPGSSQGVSPFGGKHSSFPNQTASQPVSSFPVHHQQSHPVSPRQPQVLSSHHSQLQGAANHPPSPQQQAYAMNLAKDRPMQHRFLQQQQFSASNSLMQHVPQQPQFPISSPLQNNSQVQSQTSSPSVSHSPLTSASMNPMLQHQQKNQMHNAQTSANHNIGKQRQRQQQQHQVLHSNRPHPQQRQQLLGQQQAKLSKGVGRGNLMHHNIPVDPSLLDGTSANTGNQSSEKGEPTTHLMQGQSSYPGPPLSAVKQARQYMPSQSPNQSLPQQKTYSGPVISSAKHPPQMPSQSDTSSEGQVPLVAAAAPTTSAGHQSVPSATMASSNHQQAPPHQKFVNQNPVSLQRGFQQNPKPNSDPPNKSQAGDSHSEQHAISSSKLGPMTTLPKACNNATVVAPVISPPSAQQNGSEPSFDSDTSNSPTNLGSSVPPPMSSNEFVTKNSQGPGQRLSSTSLSKIGHDVSEQWQQQSSQLQPPPSPVPQSQQQQPQLLQAGNYSSYGSPSDPRLE